MKKTMIALSFASLLLVACGGEKKPMDEKAMDETVITVDSAALKMHNTAEDLEESTEELDNMLNEL